VVFAVKSWVQLPLTISAKIAEKVQRTGKGVILGITSQNINTVNFVPQFLIQVKNNPHYGPIFLAPEENALQQQLYELGLSEEQLPAFIFYNKQGKEISRVLRVNRKENDFPKHRKDKPESQKAWNAESLYSLNYLFEKI